MKLLTFRKCEKKEPGNFVYSGVLFIFSKQNKDGREVLSLFSLSEILKPGGHLSSPFRFWQLFEKWRRRVSSHSRF